MGLTYCAIINHNNRKNISGKYGIVIRVTLDRVSRHLATGEKVEDRHWLGKENRWVKDSHPNAYDINEVIKKKFDLINKYVYRQKRFDNPVTLDGIVEFYNKKSDPQRFNEYVADFMLTGLGNRAPNTVKKYRTFVGYLNEFNGNIAFTQLDENLFRKFAAWLRDEKKMLGVTVFKYFDPFKVIVRSAVKDGYLEKDPFLFVDLQIKATKGARVYLEIEEITALKNVCIPTGRKDLASARDHFLFCFYCGFYYSDLLKLTWDAVKLTEFGPVIEAGRSKNSNGYVAPIFKFANATSILEAQKGKDGLLVFPDAISEQKYNAKLKELATLAGISKNLMNKTARHSFIQFYESQGLETQHLGKMVGHTKESTTKHYYELSVRDVSQRVSRFDFTNIDV
jgi:site-specific recombinase XerD